MTAAAPAWRAKEAAERRVFSDRKLQTEGAGPERTAAMAEEIEERWNEEMRDARDSAAALLPILERFHSHDYRTPPTALLTRVEKEVVALIRDAAEGWASEEDVALLRRSRKAILHVKGQVHTGHLRASARLRREEKKRTASA
ncbi:MAG: hypothetical protein ACF8XB_14190 [Planctomycetota bacterium JB042]